MLQDVERGARDRDRRAERRGRARGPRGWACRRRSTTLALSARSREPRAGRRARAHEDGRGRSPRCAPGARDGARARVGLVPTMGYLHAGHLSLRRAGPARERPRGGQHLREPHPVRARRRTWPATRATSTRDAALLDGAGCDLLFAPAAAEMYPPGFDDLRRRRARVAAPLEGARRPGHFRGVATVVLKLFGIFQPDRAYFGQKDAQQLAVIRRMVADLDLPRRGRGLPHGARAGRPGHEQPQRYLDAGRAPGRARALPRAHRRPRPLARPASATPRRCARPCARVLAAEPRARPDYVSVADPETLPRARAPSTAPALLLAGRLHRPRAPHRQRPAQLSARETYLNW